MAHAAYVRKSAMSLLLTVSAISSSAVWSIAMIVWFTLSSTAFTCGFLTLVGLYFRPYESEGLKVKFELTSVVVDNVLTMWVTAKPGLVYESSYHSWRLVKVGLLWLYMCIFAPLLLCTRGNIKPRLWHRQLNNFEPTSCWAYHCYTHKVNLCSVLPLMMYGPIRSTHTAS